jgi:hypothetical protein
MLAALSKRVLAWKGETTMAEVNVVGSFLITIGHGAGPEMWVAVSASRQGSALDLPSDPDDRSIELSVKLSAMFGPLSIPLRIAEVYPQGLGFAAYRVMAPNDLGVTIDRTRPATVGIVVDDATDRGQTLACACIGADVTSWFGERVVEREG